MAKLTSVLTTAEKVKRTNNMAVPTRADDPAALELTPDAPLGRRTVVLKNPDGGSETTSFDVASNPNLLTLTPNLVKKTQNTLSLTVKGDDLLPGASFSFKPEGIYTAAAYVDDQTWTLAIDIDKRALTQVYVLTITNPDGSMAELKNALVVADEDTQPNTDTATPMPDVQNPGTDTGATQTGGGSGGSSCQVSWGLSLPPTGLWLVLLLPALVWVRRRVLTAGMGYSALIPLLAGALAIATPATGHAVELQEVYATDTSLDKQQYTTTGKGVTINPGATVTIAAGSTVLTAKGASIVVNGTLIVDGTRNEVVEFNKLGSQTDKWNGIKLSGTGKLVLRFARFFNVEPTVTAIDASAKGGDVTITDSRFVELGNVLESNGGQVVVERSVILESGSLLTEGVIKITDPANGSRVSNNIIFGDSNGSSKRHSSSGIQFAINSGDGSFYVQNNTIANLQGFGLDLENRGSGKIFVQNNHFENLGTTNNALSDAIIASHSTADQLVIESNNFFNNLSNDLDALAQTIVANGGYQNSSEAPDFVSMDSTNAGFMRLKPTSKLIDAGTEDNLPFPKEQLRDIDGDLRSLRSTYDAPGVDDKQIDIGADEFKLGAPSIATMLPSELGQGGTIEVTVSGSNLPPDATFTIGTGITVSIKEWTDSDNVTLTVSAAKDATPDTNYKLTVSSDEGEDTFSNSFSILAGPRVTKVTPNVLAQGMTGVQITIEGSEFHTGITVTGNSAGLTIKSVTREAAGVIKLTVDVADDANTGSTDLVLLNTDDQGRTTSALTINPMPRVTAITPNSIKRGGLSSHKITGSGFQGQIQVQIDGAGVTIDQMLWKSDGEIDLSLTVAANAAVGERTVTLTNPEGGTTATTLKILSNPTVDSLDPNSMPQDSLVKTINVKGSDLLQGATFEFSPAGISVDEVYVNDSTWTLSVKPQNSPAGKYDLVVTNSDGSTATKTDALTLTGTIVADDPQVEPMPDTVTPTPDTNNGKDTVTPQADSQQGDTTSSADGNTGGDTGKGGGSCSIGSTPQTTGVFWLLLAGFALLVRRRRWSVR